MSKLINKRMLAVTAVLILAVPSLGAAAVVIDGQASEQLVEGHTVFTVIQAYYNDTITKSRFAAAVAVLVREYDQEARNVRFPGVLWFNDQYLVNPEFANDANIKYRYPCGGAVMAVNRGDPDPRVVMLVVGDGSDTRDVFGYDAQDNTTAGQDPTYAWLNVSTDGSANSDTVLTSAAPPSGNLQPYAPVPVVNPLASQLPMDYVESYFITDPNDHQWVIDKYVQYTRIGTSGMAPVYGQSFVWVVNTLGSPVFIPDLGQVSCGPYYDLLSYAYGQTGNTFQDDVFTGVANYGDENVGAVWDNTIAAQYPYRDLPPAGREDPSKAAYGQQYCYSGQAVGGACPTRLYNALLYFKLEDLTQAGATKTHDGSNTDTNGCHVGTEWTCPAGDDDQEGNSHKFHPTPPPGGSAPAHTDTANDCPYEFTGGNINHGGSAGLVGTPPDFSGGYYDGNGLGTPCDDRHATANIDVYFSPTGRPFAPLYRNFVVYDTAGSTAPFHDNTHHN